MPVTAITGMMHLMQNTFDTIIRKAKLTDLPNICKFTDFWLAGRGCKINAPGAVNDYFISPSQHEKYIQKYQTFMMFHYTVLIGWAVIQTDGSLIHFLINGYYRDSGFGREFLEHLDPPKIHSKSNQSSGNPAAFYEKLGYKLTESVKSKSRLDIDKIKPDRKKIIDIYERVVL